MTIAGIKTQLDTIVGTHLGLVESPDMFSIENIPDTVADGAYQIVVEDLLPNAEFGDKADRFTPQITINIQFVKRIGLQDIAKYIETITLMELVVCHVLNPPYTAWKNVTLNSATHTIKDNWMVVQCKFDFIYTLTY
jgi:hypothetical protein